MVPNRRNYYRILQIQPEAPPEVIKASWRALMHAARMHPDLGGDPQAATLINEAYAVLGDPERRRAYDRQLDPTRGRTTATDAAARPATAPSAKARRVDPAAWRTDGCCPMCRAALPAPLRAGTRCTRCTAPLAPPPDPGVAERELFGRRRATRRPRADSAALVQDWRGRGIDARLIDLSIGGASLAAATPVAVGTAVRLTTGALDAVGRVVACQRGASHWRVRVQWLTAQPLAARGVYVRATA